MSKEGIYCGTEMEDKELLCSRCRKKKRIIPAVIAAILAFLLVSCGKSPQVPADTEAVTSAEPAEIQEEPEESEEPEEDVSSQEAVEKLLEYIDRAEELQDTAAEDRKATSEIESLTGKFRLQTAILENLLPTLAELQKQTDAVNGLDPKLAAAGKEYFHLLYDSNKTFYDMWNFYADYFEFRENSLLQRPGIEEGMSTGDYYSALHTWYESATEAYAAISSCPDYLEPQWKRFGEILELNDNICNKLYFANKYNDFLRYQSAENMSGRYETLVDLQYEKFLDRTSGASAHISSQWGYAAELADEIHAYAEMGEKERSQYEFENIHTDEVTFDYSTVDTIYPSLYNSYDAFLIIKVGCVSGSKKLLVEAEIEGLTQRYKETFDVDCAYTTINVRPPAATGELDLSSAKDAQLRVSISELDGTVIDEKSFPVTIKSKYDFEWVGDEYGVATQDNILCFLTPESPAILELKRQAIDEMSAITDGQMESFVGYQNNRWNNHYLGTYLQAAGIMQAMHDMGVRYNKTSFSISNSNQRILLPKDVLEQKSGLCIETTLAVASALQSAGMHAFIVLPPGHAQVAVEVWNGRGEDTKGTGQYFLIETTNLGDNMDIYKEKIDVFLDGKAPGSGVISYMTQENWKEYLSVEGTYLIDCDDSRVLGLTPFVN